MRETNATTYIASVGQYYEIVEDSSVWGLVIKVEGAIREGWRTIGGVAVVGETAGGLKMFYQAMQKGGA